MAQIEAPAYRPRLTLDALLARAGRLPQPHTLRGDHRPTTPAERERVPHLDAPQALVLVTTVATCECGRVHRLPNASFLVRYDSAGHSNSVHYRRDTLAALAADHTHLPRERKEHAITVPFCEECFG